MSADAVPFPWTPTKMSVDGFTAGAGLASHVATGTTEMLLVPFAKNVFNVGCLKSLKQDTDLERY